jgi:branched-chain amino acid transport system permease protein
LVIPALGAALMAGFSSFIVAATTGVAIGIAESVLILAQQRVDWLPAVDLPSILPFLVIAAAMLVRGEALPSRGAVELGRLPQAVAWRIRPLLTLGVVAGLAALTILAPFEIRAGLNNSMIAVLLALSLVVVTGFVGQVSLAQMSVAGIGAFGVGTFSSEWGLPLILSLPMAVLAATAFGILLSLPSLRTRGASLAVLTLAAAVALQSVVLDRDGWFGSPTSQDASTPSLLGLDLGPSASFPGGDGKIPSPSFGLLVLVITTAAVLFVIHLRSSRLGQQMLALRSDERAAAGVGVDVAKVKIAAFAFAGALAGLGGALKAYQLGTFSSDTFSVLASLTLLAYAYLGGISTVGGSFWAGALAAGGLAAVLTDQVVQLGQYEAYVAGIVLVATAVSSNEGIDGANRALMKWIRSRRADRAAGHGSSDQQSAQQVTA